MGTVKRGSGTRIYNRFEHWRVEDCACMYCVNFINNKTPCPLKKCCVEDIRQEAIRREAALPTGGISFIETS